jgi:hypothetical protein
MIMSHEDRGDALLAEDAAEVAAGLPADDASRDFLGNEFLLWFWHHLENYNGPDPYGPPVVYVYRTVRNPKAPGGAEFVPELIHNRSGVGSHFEVADLNKDGALDIVTQTGLGTFVFLGKPGSWGRGNQAARGGR